MVPFLRFLNVLKALLYFMYVVMVRRGVLVVRSKVFVIVFDDLGGDDDKKKEC